MSKSIRNLIKNSALFVKLTNWEYWPIWASNAPLILIWLWFALRARKLTFFSAVNPAIETGGFWGESKHEILKRIPAEYLPATVLAKRGTTWEEVKKRIQNAGISYPMIAKPDIGERGFMVNKINNEQDLANYHQVFSSDYLVQEFVDLPVELAVMFHRFPDSAKGKVTSVCLKRTLKVKGDGQSNVRDMMRGYTRAKFQIARFEKENPELMDIVPAEGEIVELEPIGNHCRGTKFLNGNNHIDKRLHDAFNRVAEHMQGIYYGRFDLKCSSIESLKAGESFLIMEYNGVGGEPAHIYDPEYPLFRKYVDIYAHWKIIYGIYKLQYKKGFRGMSIKEALSSLWKYFSHMRSLKSELKKKKHA